MEDWLTSQNKKFVKVIILRNDETVPLPYEIAHTNMMMGISEFYQSIDLQWHSKYYLIFFQCIVCCTMACNRKTLHAFYIENHVYVSASNILQDVSLFMLLYVFDAILILRVIMLVYLQRTSCLSRLFLLTVVDNKPNVEVRMS